MGTLLERILQERVLQERNIQERILQERNIQERILQERILQERSLEECENGHFTPIAPAFADRSEGVPSRRGTKIPFFLKTTCTTSPRLCG